MSQLVTEIELKHSLLHTEQWDVNPKRLLLALSGVESSFGRKCGLRVEPGYSPGGTYFKRSAELQEKFEHWGWEVCGSYGPFQILFCTAMELGYPGRPADLFFPSTSIIYVLKLINARILPQLETELGEFQAVEKIADAYNSGNPKDKIVPQSYISRVLAYYKMSSDELAQMCA